MVIYPSKNSKRIIIVFLLVLLVIFLNIPGVRTSLALQSARSLIIAGFYPLQFLVHRVVRGIGGTFENIITLRFAEEENKKFKVELAEKSLKIDMYKEIEKENQTLKTLLNYKNKEGRNFSLVLAEVIGRSPNAWFDMVEIDAGSSLGIKEGNPVISEGGVVGRVEEVARWSSKVLLLSDQNSSISGMDSVSREIGLVVGGQENNLLMRYVPSSADVGVGDLIVTSGMSENFPKGIPIGTVSKVIKKDYDLFQYIEIRPAVNFPKLSWVFVIK